jgi:hypothetical protein
VEDLLTMPHRHRPEGDHHPSHFNTRRDNLGDSAVWIAGKVVGIVFVGAALLAGRRLISNTSK